jgi:anthranilate synthase component 2
MKVLLLDNYDSFTYNLAQLLDQEDCAYEVHRNDKITLDEVKCFDKILISPGPGVPGEAGVLKDVVKTYGSSKSILGICLGHQGIAEVYGAQLLHIQPVLHGVTSITEVKDEDDYLFQGVSKKFQTTHYHSWAVDPTSINGNLNVTAINENGLVMALRHSQYDVRGLQFHPESLMTPEGPKIISNWINH